LHSSYLGVSLTVVRFVQLYFILHALRTVENDSSINEIKYLVNITVSDSLLRKDSFPLDTIVYTVLHWYTTALYNIKCIEISK